MWKIMRVSKASVIYIYIYIHIYIIYICSKIQNANAGYPAFNKNWESS